MIQDVLTKQLSPGKPLFVKLDNKDFALNDEPIVLYTKVPTQDAINELEKLQNYLYGMFFINGFDTNIRVDDGLYLVDKLISPRYENYIDEVEHLSFDSAKELLEFFTGNDVYFTFNQLHFLILMKINIHQI